MAAICSSGPARPPAAADEQGRQRGEHHERDPGIACSAVQAWALYLAAACPQGHRAQGGGQHGGGEVDGDSGAEVRQGRQGGGHGVHLCGMAGMDVTVPLPPAATTVLRRTARLWREMQAAYREVQSASGEVRSCCIAWE